MKAYKVYDLYEGKETLGYCDTLEEVQALSNERYDDTDGECSIWYAELNPETNKYKYTSRIFVAGIY